MNDEKRPDADKTKPPLRTPNREYQRMPRVIEGEALSTSKEASATESAVDKLETASASTTTPEATQADVEPAHPISSDLPADSIATAEEGARARDATLAETAASDSQESEWPPKSPPPPPTSPPPPPRGYGLGAVAAASLGSAALAALAVFGLQTMNAPAGPSPALETRLAEVERQSAAMSKTPQISPASIAALEKRVASVETVAAGAAEAARKAAEAAASPPASNQQDAAVSPQALGALSDRIALLEKNVSTAANIDGRIAAIEKTLAAPKTDERATETRIEPTPPPDLDPLRKQTAALEARLQTLERQTAPLAEAARAAESRLKGVEASVQPLAGQIEETRARGEAERKRAEAMAQRSAGAAQIALAQSISAAIASGAPFAAQIEALARLGLPADKLAPLRESAKAGVATNAELARTLAALEPKIVARVEAPADASVIDRLTSSAFGLVRVRPAGETTGASPADIYARMTRAVQNGDIALAVNEWDNLPESAKADSAEWAMRAKQRLAGESAARALLAEQAQTLGRS
ncbi:MAG: hypothetical protein Q8M31_01205 [Beijerinckiaceae bacterium]|nr:hypothetical protein [Beijerinckiaceae bacterium]